MPERPTLQKRFKKLSLIILMSLLKSTITKSHIFTTDFARRVLIIRKSSIDQDQLINMYIRRPIKVFGYIYSKVLLILVPSLQGRAFLLFMKREQRI